MLKTKRKRATNKRKGTPRIRWKDERKMSGTIGGLSFNFDPESQLDFLAEQARMAAH